MIPRYIEITDAHRVLCEYYNYRTVDEKYRLSLALSHVPTADVVEKERYDRLLEHANILAEEMRKYQTADVPERNVGKWKKSWHSYFKQELPCCSVCGHFSAMRWKYCPNCGADMRGGPDAQLD